MLYKVIIRDQSKRIFRVKRNINKAFIQKLLKNNLIDGNIVYIAIVYSSTAQHIFIVFVVQSQANGFEYVAVSLICLLVFFRNHYHN